MTSDSTVSALVPNDVDEGPHEPDDDRLWSDSHYLDAVSPDAAAGVYARLGRLANQGCSHVMIAIVRPGAGPATHSGRSAFFPMAGTPLAAPFTTLPASDIRKEIPR